MSTVPVALADIMSCFSGLIPASLVTLSADGTPNVTYLSRVHPVDGERIAMSNQFMSKSKRNLAEHPRASLLLLRPETLEEYRLEIVFEQTLTRGPVFERMRNDLSMIAALTGMQDVFRLRAADVFRVVAAEQVVLSHRVSSVPFGESEFASPQHAALGELCGRLARCADLDALVQVTVEGLDTLLGYDHSMLLLVDETGERLFTIASHGYPEEGVGSEVALGEGMAGLAAARCTPMQAANVHQMARYARSVTEGGPEVPMPGLTRPGSQLAVPALALGELVGVLLVESPQSGRYTEADAAVLSVVATLVASTVERLRTEARGARTSAAAVSPAVPAAAPGTGSEPVGPVVAIRHFAVDGSTFIDGDYLIKGVAGKVLWTLLRQREADGRTEFTNRELRLDPTLDLPDFRDNLESRLILLKRRLDERAAPVRIERTGRGRFRLLVDRPLRLDAATP